MRLTRAIPLAIAITSLLAACSDDDTSGTNSSSVGSEPAGGATAAETTAAPASSAAASTIPDTTAAPPTTAAPTTAAPVEPLRILVTNDDGYAAEGIDAVVEYLMSLPDVEVSVVAPLENQSGAGDKTSRRLPSAREVETVSGFPATAVDGFPADSVRVALRRSSFGPIDLVVSGSNEGQNYTSTLVPVSGTVGAAATGARAGIPAIAISQGLRADGRPPHYEASVEALDTYLDATLDEYRAGTAADMLVSINVPTCPEGIEPFGMRIAPPATDLGDRQLLADPPCDGPLRRPPRDDLDAFNHGHPSLSAVDPETLAGVEFTGDRTGR
jgi:5'-nucleotidase